jgi:hypothetical protein
VDFLSLLHFGLKIFSLCCSVLFVVLKLSCRCNEVSCFIVILGCTTCIMLVLQWLFLCVYAYIHYPMCDGVRCVL